MYSVTVSRQAIKDIVGLPKEYARLVSQQLIAWQRIRIHPTQKRFAELWISVCGREYIEFSTVWIMTSKGSLSIE
jgi:hypothetical protein